MSASALLRREVVRRTTPVSRERLVLCGELLTTLAEGLLREQARARQLEATSKELTETLRLKDEFFAVLSEVFFVEPTLLRHEYLAVYQQFARFYRQEPATRTQLLRET